MKTYIDLMHASCGTASGAETPTNEAGRYQVYTAENFTLVLDIQTRKTKAKSRSSDSVFKNDENFSGP
jgi:hypothetical protein